MTNVYQCCRRQQDIEGMQFYPCAPIVGMQGGNDIVALPGKHTIELIMHRMGSTFQSCQH